jgi:hypothetical protein
MLIEPGAQRTLKLRRSGTFDVAEGTLRSSGAKELSPATWAINIWPLCGQGTIRRHNFRDTTLAMLFSHEYTRPP